MKKLQPILYILLSPFLSLAQVTNYHSFPDSNALWNYNYSMFCFQNGQANDDYSIMYNGDTLINSYTYHQLYITYIKESATTASCTWITTGYKGAIREDKNNRLVYFVPPNDSVEQLLYDFNMEVGDTVRGYIQSSQNSDVVQSIDSVLVGNNYHKRWVINSCYNIAFIEGIGSTYGLIEPSFGCITDMPDFTLLCFNNGLSIYPSTSTCETITSLHEIKKKNNSVSVYPNPTSEYIYVDFSDLHNFTNLLMIIYSVDGKIKMKKNLSNPQTMLPISTTHFSNGVYFYSIKDHTETLYSGKIIIER